MTEAKKIAELEAELTAMAERHRNDELALTAMWEEEALRWIECARAEIERFREGISAAIIEISQGEYHEAEERLFRLHKGEAMPFAQASLTLERRDLYRERGELRAERDKLRAEVAHEREANSRLRSRLENADDKLCDAQKLRGKFDSLRSALAAAREVIRAYFDRDVAAAAWLKEHGGPDADAAPGDRLEWPHEPFSNCSSVAEKAAKIEKGEEG